MKASEPAAPWDGTFGILLLTAVIFAFPRRYEFGPSWSDAAFTVTLMAILLASVATNLIHTSGRVRNASILAVVGLMSVYNALALWDLIVLLVFPASNRPEIEAPRLLASAVSIWLTNVLTFALLYWAIDGDGPERRLRDPESPRDFAFPADLRRPRYAEYLFLAFNTATAFSPTDTLPLTTRVRVMMMLESTVSLIALAIAAARAINILR